MGILIIILILLGLPWRIDAAWLQFRTSDFRVIGAFANESDMRLGASDDSLEIPGVAVADIAWPVPAGCVKGKAAWTKVTAPGTLPLILDLPAATILFSSETALLPECQEVTSLNALWNVVRTAIRGGMAQDPLSAEKSDINIMNLVLCPTAETDPDCPTIASKLATINNVQAGQIAAFSTFLDAVTTLMTDATALACTQGWITLGCPP